MLDEFIKRTRKLAGSDDGPTSVEYAVMLAMIVTVCCAAIQTVGCNVAATFVQAANSLTR